MEGVMMAMCDEDFKDRCVFVVLCATGFALICVGLDFCQGSSLAHAIETAMINAGFWGMVAIVTALTN
jgi:hypothetical protein